MVACSRVVTMQLVRSGSDLKAEPTEFAARSNEGCERKGLPEPSTRLCGQTVPKAALELYKIMLEN